MPFTTSSRPRHRRLARVVSSALTAPLAIAALAAPAAAQSVPAPSTLVSVCSGVSLPRSVVIDIMSPVLTGIYGPVENRVNGILGVLTLNPLVLNLTGQPAPLSVNVNGLLTTAASGSNIGLNVVAQDGTLVGPASTCNATADGYTLDTPQGLAIGGNMISGLGASGQQATAGEINSVALGNRAQTDALAANSIAIGPDAAVGAGGSNSVALGSAASATAANSVALGAGAVASRGAVSGYSAPLLSGTYNSAGEISVGAPGALRQLTNVAPGSAPTDAANIAQLQALAALVPTDPVVYNGASHTGITLSGAGGTTITNLAAGTVGAASSDAVNGSQLYAVQQQASAAAAAAANSVQYDGASQTSVTLGGAGGTLLTNVAAGTVGAASSDAVNGSQLFAVQQQASAAATTAANSVQYDGASQTSITFGGAGGTVLTNVAAGTVVAGSTDAVNGDQLFALSQQVTGLASATANGVQYDDTTQAQVTLGGAAGTVVTNVADGNIAAGSTDAVNGGQLAATNAQVATNTANIANLTTQVNTNTGDINAIQVQIANLTVAGGSPVQYSNPATPTTSNGGVATNDVTIVGANAGPVTVHNVAAGVVAAGSTDAVNGSQLAATNVAVQTAQTTANQAQATATQAQTTATQAQGTATQALVLASNSVQYDNPQRTSATLNPGGSATRFSNVATGTAATDAVNVAQLQAVASGAVTSAVNTAVTQANAYTDARFLAMNYDLRAVRREARAGSAAALAAAALPQPLEPGRSMIAGGVGTYGGRSALAIGASHASDDGRSVFRVGLTYDTNQRVGANAGYGFQF